ncbi:unnamed protein product [Cochlearia groenlandica]
MVLGNSTNHKSHHHHHDHDHHHHHDRNMMKEYRVAYAVEEPIQAFECVDMMRRTQSEKMYTREVTKQEDVDKEAEEFIKFEHTKFTKWMSKRV